MVASLVASLVSLVASVVASLVSLVASFDVSSVVGSYISSVASFLVSLVVGSFISSVAFFISSVPCAASLRKWSHLQRPRWCCQNRYIPPSCLRFGRSCFLLNCHHAQN